MPFIKRQVEPIEISRARVPRGVSNDLEFNTNSTLANIILQLSSLCKHAGDLFEELYKESEHVLNRSAGLQQRLERLQEKVQSLDSNVEEVSLQEINQRKPFRSNRHCSAQVVSRETMPSALKKLYDSCEPPPPLDALNPYRTDGKDGLKFYTDPGYFFELWRTDMLKETDARSKSADGRGRKTGRSRSPGEKLSSPTHHALPTHQQQARSQQLHRPPAEQQQYINSIPTSSQYPQYSISTNGAAPLTNGNGNDMNYSIYSQAPPASHAQPVSDIYNPNRPTQHHQQQQMQNYLEYQHQQQQMDNLQQQYSQLTLQKSYNEAAYHNSLSTSGYSSSTNNNLPHDYPTQSYESQQQQVQINYAENSGTLVNRTTAANIESGANYASRPMHRPPAPPISSPIPPPPPIEDEEITIVQEKDVHIHSTQILKKHIHHEPAAPPPPPPPPPLGSLSGKVSYVGDSEGSANMTNGFNASNDDSTPNLPAKHNEEKRASPEFPPITTGVTIMEQRSDLLAAIRKGIQLRKVEQENKGGLSRGPSDAKNVKTSNGDNSKSTRNESGDGEKKDKPNATKPASGSTLHDVASILARRMALQYSDSEEDEVDGNESKSAVDTDEWDDN